MMKAVLFTLDSIFALLIAMMSISILLFFQYYAQTPYSIHYSNAQSVLANLASTTLESEQNGSTLVKSMANQFLGANETWPQFLGGQQRNSSNFVGPTQAIVSYIFTPGNTVGTGIVADYGNIYFAAGNTLYAVNATSNAIAWSKNTISNVVSTPALYSGLLVFANTTNLTAVSARTGSVLWSTNSIKSITPVTTALAAYHNQIIFGSSDNYVHSYYANNGTSYWSNSLGTTPVSVAVLRGNIEVETSSHLVAFVVQAGGSAQQLISTTFAAGNPPTNNLAVSGSNIYFGSSSSANAIYSNGTVVNSIPQNFPVSDGIGALMTGVAVYKNSTVYQASNAVISLSPLGASHWSVVVPGYFGNAMVNSTPVISSQMVYTLWTNGLAAQNLSTGSILWFSLIPKVTISPYMTLAYGRLYVVANNQILAYGSCSAPLHASVLSAAASMYMNSQWGCGSALLNNAFPLLNYSFFVGDPTAHRIQSASFNGINGYVIARNSRPLNITTTAVSFWLNISSIPPNGARIVNYGDNGTCISPVTYCGWIFYLTNAGTVRFSVLNQQQTTANSIALKTNTWYLVTGVYNQTDASLYINNGPPSKTHASGALAATSPNINLTIGAGLPSDSRYLTGNIANLQVYRAGILRRQVAQIYSRGVQGVPLANYGLVAWYPLNGDANDYSNFNPGYSVGAAKFVTSNYIAPGLANAYQVTKASILLPVFNFTSGITNTIPAGVYSWS